MDGGFYKDLAKSLCHFFLYDKSMDTIYATFRLFTIVIISLSPNCYTIF